MKPNQEQIEDQLLDALLHEQNRSDREAALADIEAALDQQIMERPTHVRSKWPKRLGVIAASVAVGGLTAFWMDSYQKEKSELALIEIQKSRQQEIENLRIAIRIKEDELEERRKELEVLARIRIPAQQGTQELSALVEDKIQLETQIKSLLEYSGDELSIYAASLDLPDNVVKILLPQKLELKRQIDELKASGYGGSHPTVVSNQKVLDLMNTQLDQAIIDIRTRLISQLELSKGQLATVELKRDETKKEALALSIDTRDYADAKRELEAGQRQLGNLKGQMAGATADSDTRLAANEKSQQQVLSKPSAPTGSMTKVIASTPPSSNVLPANLAMNDKPRASVGRQILADAIDDDSGMLRKRIVGGYTGDESINTERYGQLIDPTWQRPTEKPLSTFSIDVDTASYSNIRRMIREGRTIPADAVRIEECINAFNYHYEPPSDDKAFAVHTELATCPWNKNNLLVKFGIKGREISREKRPVSNLVFLIDVSGSMQSSNKLPLVKESLKLLLHQLDERDSVSYVVYAGSEGVVLPPTKMTESGRVKALAALEKLEAGGSTNGGAGINRAYQLAQENFIEGGVNRVILASDGDFNVGVTGQEALVSMVKERAAKNVYLSVLAFGTGNLNDSMFEAISKDGNGNYFYIDSIREGRKVFLENLTGSLITIAKDVKIQVEFNPAKVGSYRLIGYANRVLKNEDFNNDKIDAGDIGAGHTVTAFYEIVPAGSAQPSGEVDPLKYQKEPAPAVVKPESGSSDEWLTLKLRHKHPEGDISALQESVLKGEATAWQKSGDDFQFATAVAMFGMKLRGMDDVSQISWEGVRELARSGLKDDKNEDRAEFVELISELEKRSR